MYYKKPQKEEIAKKPDKPLSIKEKRIKDIINLYYSRPEIQEAIFQFSKNRESVPSFMMQAFGKRPDSLEYPGDVYELSKKGATSFHCSEEIWKNPLDIVTGMNEQQSNELRTGWDLLLDIDSKYIDYSKIMVVLILELLKFHGIKNVGVKFSGSKGFHMIVPWKAFPKEINNIKTSDMFPEYPKIMMKYIMKKVEPRLVEEISKLTRPNKYIKDFQASKEVIPDLMLASPRHLFRAPYSLHEKTALASAVLDLDKISDFDLKDANPLKIKIKNFMPDCKEGEAKELLMQALDWSKEAKNKEPEKKDYGDMKYKAIKLTNIQDKNFPPSIKQILQGIDDGRKRALFVLINLFRSIGMEKVELEKRIEDWNGKNKVPLKQGYIKSQLMWSYRNKVVPPPNFDKDYYKGIGINPTAEELRYKNPSNYIVKKTLTPNPNKKKFKPKQKKKDNFKNKS
jgi:hypothetical protein